MRAWFDQHGDLLAILGVVSIVTFIATLVLVPILVARLPEDYFSHPRRRRSRWGERHPVLRAVVLIAKNLLGVVLVLAGVGMMFLPGQGVLTILIGLMLVNFPGKYRLERWIARRRSVMRAMNWLRRRAHRPPLRAPA
jgi:hypothetical protein